jgi:hypothetical protein
MQPQQEPIPASAPTSIQQKPRSSSATTGLILGIVAFLLIMIAVAIRGAGIFAGLGSIAAFAAIVFSIVGAVSCRATGVRRGMGIAIAGIIVSLFVLMLGIYAIQWVQQM